MEDRLQQAYFNYRAWCRSKKVSGASLPFTLARFGKEKWQAVPELSTQYKASAVKVMLFWIADFLIANVDAAPEPWRNWRMVAAYSLAMFQYVLDTHGPWLSFAEAAEAVGHGRLFLLCYQRLALHSRSTSTQRQNYKITPKFHSFLHMLLTMERTRRNPRTLGRSAISMFLFAALLLFLETESRLIQLMGLPGKQGTSTFTLKNHLWGISARSPADHTP